MSNEKPILFSGPMVRAILEGRKTQTRRVVKIQPNGICRITQSGEFEDLQIGGSGKIKCPYPVGTRLWVRETWCEASPEHRDKPNVRQAFYRADQADPADPESEEIRQEYIRLGHDYKWRPSIFMPRWASRITLEVTEVRVQRLQEIDRSDCIAEGVESWEGCRENRFPEGNFKALWNSINGPGAWDANPWVWAYTFKVVEAPDADR